MGLLSTLLRQASAADGTPPSQPGLPPGCVGVCKTSLFRNGQFRHVNVSWLEPGVANSLYVLFTRLPTSHTHWADPLPTYSTTYVAWTLLARRPPCYYYLATCCLT